MTVMRWPAASAPAMSLPLNRRASSGCAAMNRALHGARAHGGAAGITVETCEQRGRSSPHAATLNAPIRTIRLPTCRTRPTGQRYALCAAAAQDEPDDHDAEHTRRGPPPARVAAATALGRPAVPAPVAVIEAVEAGRARVRGVRGAGHRALAVVAARAAGRGVAIGVSRTGRAEATRRERGDDARDRAARVVGLADGD